MKLLFLLRHKQALQTSVLFYVQLIGLKDAINFYNLCREPEVLEFEGIYALHAYLVLYCYQNCSYACLSAIALLSL